MSEDWHIGCAKDSYGVEHGPLNFVACLADHLRGGFNDASVQTAGRGVRSRGVRPLAQMPNGVLVPDYGAVHDHPEIERAERKKICGNLAHIQPNRSEQQSKRNREGNDEGSTHDAEKKE